MPTKLSESELAEYRNALRTRDLTTCEAEALLDHITALEEELKSSKAWQMDVEEREAAVCPEDVGFDEYIRHLQEELKAAQDEMQEWRKHERCVCDDHDNL